MHSSTNALNRQVCAFISPRRFELCSSNTATKPEKSCTKSTDAPLTCLPLRFPGIAGPWGACYSTSADGSTPTLRLTVRSFSRSCTCDWGKNRVYRYPRSKILTCLWFASKQDRTALPLGPCCASISSSNIPVLRSLEGRGTADCTPVPVALHRVGAGLHADHVRVLTLTRTGTISARLMGS